MSSPSQGKKRGRFHWPTSSKTAPAATWAGWIVVTRTGSKSSPRSRPARSANETGRYGGRNVVVPSSPGCTCSNSAATRIAFTFASLPCSEPVPIVV